MNYPMNPMGGMMDHQGMGMAQQPGMGMGMMDHQAMGMAQQQGMGMGMMDHQAMGMAQQPGMGMMQQQGVVPGLLGPQGFVNMDPEFAPGLVTLDVGYPCPQFGPMHHHHHHCPQPVPQPAPMPTPQPMTYVVKQGDSVYTIAQRFGTTMQAIILGNNLRNPDLIYPGQVLYIPGV